MSTSSAKTEYKNMHILPDENLSWAHTFVQSIIDLVTVFDAILTSRQTREKLQCLYENPMSNNFRKTAVLEKIWTVK